MINTAWNPDELYLVVKDITPALSCSSLLMQYARVPGSNPGQVILVGCQLFLDFGSRFFLSFLSSMSPLSSLLLPTGYKLLA